MSFWQNLISKDEAFQQQHKGIFRVLDILMILTVLMNFGAFGLTEAFVHKQGLAEAKEKNLTVVIAEANPIAAKTNNYQQVESSKIIPILKNLLFHALKICLMLSFYIWQRFTTKNTFGLITLILAITMLFATLGLDFFNNLGIIISHLLFYR